MLVWIGYDSSYQTINLKYFASLIMNIIFLINIILSARFSAREGEGGRQIERERERGERQRERQRYRDRERERKREDNELFKTLVPKLLYLRFLIRWPNNIEKFK